jgi:WhiB family redox-sensing transcriptional regulator
MPHRRARTVVHTTRNALSIWERIGGRPAPWKAEGLCAQTDPDAFYPEKGESTGPAKRICQACPVRPECLADALARGERFGVWGGTSDRERRRLRQQQQPETANTTGTEERAA